MTRALGVALRLAIAAVFLYAGAMKVGHTALFAEEIGNYHLLPALAPLLAIVIPTIEITVGAALVVGPPPWRRSAALLGGALLLVFTVALASAWLRHINLECGCFGAASEPLSALTVLRDVAFLAALVVSVSLEARAVASTASARRQ